MTGSISATPKVVVDEECADCYGTGRYPERSRRRCRICEGTGRMLRGYPPGRTDIMLHLVTELSVRL